MSENEPKIEWRNSGHRVMASTVELSSSTKFSVRDGTVSVPDFPTAAHAGELRSVAARERNDMNIHLHSLLDAEAGLKAIKALADAEDTDSALMRTVWVGVIVSYTRCYGEGPRYKLKPEDVFLADIALRAHEDVWNLRSKHMAHDVSDFRLAVTAGIMDEQGEVLGIGSWQGLAQFDTTFFSNMYCLVRDSTAFVKSRLATLDETLHQELECMTPAERLALSEPVLLAGGWERIKQPRRSSEA